MDYVPLDEARKLEAYCYVHRCIESTFETIPCWQYNDITLFETEKEHLHFSHYAYATNVLRIYNLLKAGAHNGPDGPDLWYNVTFENTKYKQFQDEYQDHIHNAQKVLAEKTTSSTGLFKCTKCQSLDVDTEQKQTRAADEPMTVFCTCTRCGARWTLK